MHVETTLLINATRQFYIIGILNHYYLNNLVNQRRTRLIKLVALRLSDVVHKNAVQNITKAS